MTDNPTSDSSAAAVADQPVTFVVLGASGDLARRKLFPALFALFARGFLPRECRFAGFARTELDDRSFRELLAESLRCEEIEPGACQTAAGEFLRRCHYGSGRYDRPEDLRALGDRLDAIEERRPTHRMFYFALPPSVFVPACTALGAAGLAQRDRASPWTRAVFEKPFGHDRASSDALSAAAAQVFAEEQTYRIDHYLGKEAIQNLMALRFANAFFEPVWNRHHIAHVHILWKEDLDLGGRGGYFDQAGIIRDVMQNHLTQILALVAMECPYRMTPQCIRDEKVRLLRQVLPLPPDRLACGQYVAATLPDGRRAAGYRETPGVPPDSRTPTFAAALLECHSPRWRGVPFLMSAGKGLDTRMTEIRIHFRPPDSSLFQAQKLRPNALVVRVQPDEAIQLEFCNKVPGPGMRLEPARLDLQYRKAFPGRIADAYENLLLDVVRGDRSLFLRNDELQASWDIFDPVLRDSGEGSPAPEPYPFGSRGPAGARALAARFGLDDANE